MVLRRSCLPVFFLGLIAAPAAFGQAKNSPIAFVNQEAITTSFVATPVFNSTGSAPPSPSEALQWLKVEFHYGTTLALKTPYVDAVEFKVWIEGRDLQAPEATTREGIAVGLTGSVTYVNIPAGKDIYGVFYVHPSTLGRYSGTRGYEDFDRKFNIHLEAYVGGALMDAIDKNREKDPNWFTQLKAIPNLVYRLDQSPFILDNPDHYQEIKLPPATP